MDLRFIPLLLSGIFVILQLVYAVLMLYRGRSQSKQEIGASSDVAVASEEEENGTRPRALFNGSQESVRIRGGFVIFGFMVVRLVDTLLLLYLFATTNVQDCRKAVGSIAWVQVYLCAQESLTIALVSISHTQH